MGDYCPTVDILIPTYNESVSILRRTIVGCQAIDYPKKEVYLLDDGNREEVRFLAGELGCQYIARENHQHAKAGNLNHALGLTNGELVAVFDADFVPTRNFLVRTVGFFQKSKLALLQTHQHFYNQDTVARNLGLGDRLGHPTEECSSRMNQPMRDRYNSVMCYGSSFLVRRQCLDVIGGFNTESISEDYFTTIQLLAQKYHVIYLTERLSAGLVPENIPGLFRQRMRWAKGTIQGFFVSANPLTIKGLNFRQRLIYATGIIHWFSSLTLAISMIVFPLCFVFKIPPFIISLEDWFAYFLPLLFFQFTVFYWLCDRSTAKIVADIYSFVLAFPISVVIIETLITPFSGGFNVTPKGISSTKPVFRWYLCVPLIYAWLMTIFSIYVCVSLLLNSELSEQFIAQFELSYSSLEIGLFWNIYYFILLSLAIISFVDQPQTEIYPRINLKTPVNVIIDNCLVSGYTNYLSEGEANITIFNFDELPKIDSSSNILLEIGEVKLKVKAKLHGGKVTNKGLILDLYYPSLSLEEYREMVEFLFCQPYRWETKKVPSDLPALILLLKSLMTMPLKYLTFSPRLKSQREEWEFRGLTLK